MVTLTEAELEHMGLRLEGCECCGSVDLIGLREVISAREARAWDAARERIREASPDCSGECDLCLARGEILDDLSENPYRGEQ